MDVNTVREVDMVLSKARAKVQELASEFYASWLAAVCAEACDMVALGTMQRPEDRLLVDVARDVLAARIKEAKSLSLPTPYNTRVQGHVLEYDGKCYLRIVNAGPALMQALRDTPGLVDISVPDAGTEESAGSPEFPGDPAEWRKVFASYEDGPEPGWYDLSPVFDPGVMPGAFPSVSERADVLARRGTVEEYLAAVSRGQSIQPVDLMRRLDEATEYALSSHGIAAVAERKTKLMGILVDLDKHPEAVLGDSAPGLTPA